MSAPPDTGWLTGRPFAHRGLHGGGRSENGMAAFSAAIDAGHGIECDVRASRDGVAFVFHDRDLARMAGRPERVSALDAATLDGVRLPDGGAIPRLSDLLAKCSGGVPLLVEIKAEGQEVGPLCRAVARELAGTDARRVAIMSFNPRVARRFARLRRGQVRGLIVTQQGKGRWRGAVERALALWWAKPDFLACDIRDLPSAFSARARARGMPMLTWTVRTPDERARAAAHADQIIFELADE
ncbi:glycerophosphodiester phosphodiesterase [Sphingobium amiense]|uniref:Glycerophosphodiester phosphodiesterase n=1 Tax=Sphingobium amiense TaxID=135719 RepID=A0A494W6A8_9SPHN|nr:glycerophosphodiester phosphodiesterase family protein [Sphingobium amiense]BBD99781.1 glycerophosphodiester phosphodiesterase [Sphingobium amiense]